MTRGATMSQTDPGSPSELMNTLVRMVVPMRREFGRQLDVRHFLHDLEYAREVIQQALTSQDPRLLQYAKYVQAFHLGPRNASNTPAAAHTAVEQSPAPPAAPASAAADVAAAPSSPTAAELRERVLRKYTSGLR